MLSFLSIITLITFYIHALQSLTDPFTSFATSSRNMPNDQSSLLLGYHASTNRIWLIGGDRNSATTRNEVWYYDIDTNYFTDVRSLTSNLDELFSQSSTYIGDSIYFVNSNKLLRFDIGATDVTSYDLGTTATSTVLSPCITKSKDENYIFIVAGEPSSDPDDGTVLFQIYDIQNSQFSTGNSLNYKRRFLSCNVSPDGNSLYVFGGIYESGSDMVVARTSIEKLDVSDINAVKSKSVTWSVTSMTMASNEWYSRSIVDYVNNLIYIIGGRTDDATESPEDKIQIVNATSNTIYSSAKRLKDGRAAPSVINVNQKVYVFGGYTANNVIFQTFETCTLLDLSPTPMPTKAPTLNPSISPTNIPTVVPSNNPSAFPSSTPTYNPTTEPTNNPTATETPTIIPTVFPTEHPSNDPTNIPTLNPTNNPTTEPTTMPTKDPTTNPSDYPTTEPTTNTPSHNPTEVGDAEQVGEATEESDNSGPDQDSINTAGQESNYFILIAVSCVTLLCCTMITVFLFHRILVLSKRTKAKAPILVVSSDSNGTGFAGRGTMEVEMIEKRGEQLRIESISDITDIQIQSGVSGPIQSVIPHPPPPVFHMADGHGRGRGENNSYPSVGEDDISEDEENDDMYAAKNNIVHVTAGQIANNTLQY